MVFRKSLIREGLREKRKEAKEKKQNLQRS